MKMFIIILDGFERNYPLSNHMSPFQFLMQVPASGQPVEKTAK